MADSEQRKQWTILSLIQWSEKYLAEKGIESPRLNAELMLAEVLGYKRIDLYTRFDKPLVQQELDRYKKFFIRRVNREPLQYILGYTYFYGRRFRVSPGVLIPRPETEHIVEATIQLTREQNINTPYILDIGTGSGCIAISLALEIKDARINAIDVSDIALKLAEENAALNSVQNEIKFEKKNLFNANDIITESKTYDFVVSNPPYIPETEWRTLADEVKVYEPKEALTDGGDGFAYLKGLTNLAPKLLHDGGWLICEIGYNQFETVQMLFKSNGARKVISWNDLNGIKRIIGGLW